MHGHKILTTISPLFDNLPSSLLDCEILDFLGLWLCDLSLTEVSIKLFIIVSECMMLTHNRRYDMVKKLWATSVSYSI